MCLLFVTQVRDQGILNFLCNLKPWEGIAVQTEEPAWMFGYEI